MARIITDQTHEQDRKVLADLRRQLEEARGQIAVHAQASRDYAEAYRDTIKSEVGGNSWHEPWMRERAALQAQVEALRGVAEAVIVEQETSVLGITGETAVNWLRTALAQPQSEPKRPGARPGESLENQHERELMDGLDAQPEPVEENSDDPNRA